MASRLVTAATTTSAVGGVGGVNSGNRSSSMLPVPRPLPSRTTTTTTPFPCRRHNLIFRATPSSKQGGGGGGGGFKGFGAKKKSSPSTTERGTPPPPPWVADAAACPCCSGRKLDACCGPFLSRAALPDTAEQLMRSRFAAYVRKDADYIIESTHPENPAAAGSRRPDGAVASTLAQDVAATIKRISWQRLKVEGVEGGERDDDEGFVTFTAWFKVTGQKGSRADGGDAVGTMSERSRFVRVAVDGDDDNSGSDGKKGRWSYREGVPVINGVPRVFT